jgi:nucleotide-binding universal stress UspA family protein
MMFGRKNDAAEKQASGIFRKILLVVDGSEPSIAAANFAVRLALDVRAAIIAAYVVDTATMDYLMQMRIFVSEEREEFERDLETTGKRYLDYVQAIAKKQGFDQMENVMLKGPLHREILRQAREMGADLIVVGGWRRSITSKDTASVERQLILDEASRPVLVVKAE